MSDKVGEEKQEQETEEITHFEFLSSYKSIIEKGICHLVSGCNK
jgi:hypothetical protein